MRYSTQCPTCQSTVRSWSGDDYARCGDCDSDVFVPKIKPLEEDDSGSSFGMDRSSHNFGFEDHTQQASDIATPTNKTAMAERMAMMKMLGTAGIGHAKAYKKAADLAVAGRREESIKLLMDNFNTDRKDAEEIAAMFQKHLTKSTSGATTFNAFQNPTREVKKAGYVIAAFVIIFFTLLAIIIFL